MDEMKFAERLAAVEASAKSAHKRLDDIKQLVDSIRVLAYEVKTMREDMNGMQADMDELKTRPAKKWDTAARTALTAFVSGAVGYALAALVSYFPH